MSRSRYHGLIVCGYLLFGLMAFFVFLYRTFPFDLLQEKIARTFESETGCQTDVDRQSAAFPLTLTWHDVQVHCPHVPSFPLESFLVNVGLRSLLFQPEKQFVFDIRMPANMGEMKGELHVQNTVEGMAFALQEEGKNINLYAFGLQGVLHTQGNGHWTGNNPLVGTGTHTFTLENLHIGFQEQTTSPAWIKALSAVTPLVGITSLSIPTLRGEMAWQNQTLSLKTLYADSEIAEITNGSGSVTLQEPVSQSVVSLTFTVVPRGKLASMAAFFIPRAASPEPLTLVVTGMLSSPEVSINGMRLPSLS